MLQLFDLCVFSVTLRLQMTNANSYQAELDADWRNTESRHGVRTLPFLRNRKTARATQLGLLLAVIGTVIVLTSVLALSHYSSVRQAADPAHTAALN